MRTRQKMILLVLTVALVITGCTNRYNKLPAWKSLLIDFPEEVYVCPRDNVFKYSRVGVFRFEEPSYAPGTGKAAADALFDDLLKKGVFSYVSNEASQCHKGLVRSRELARSRGYDLMITGDVTDYMDGSDYLSSKVNERISVIHVLSGRILWSASANSQADPVLAKDYYLFQSSGAPATPTPALMQRNAAKFSNMLLKQPVQRGRAEDCDKLLLNSHRSAFETLEKNVDSLLAKNKLLEQQLLKEVKKGKGLKEEVDELSVQADQLEVQLKDEIEKGKIRLNRYKSKTIINIDNSICFDSGSAVLKNDAKRSLKKISNALKAFPDNNIQIEGHSDNIPIRSRRYPSNWELSSSRALAVLRFLLDHSKIDPGRLSAAGCGEYRPIVPNNSRKNKRLNRRVDIVIMPSNT